MSTYFDIYLYTPCLTFFITSLIIGLFSLLIYLLQKDYVFLANYSSSKSIKQFDIIFWLNTKTNLENFDIYIINEDKGDYLKLTNLFNFIYKSDFLTVPEYVKYGTFYFNCVQEIPSIVKKKLERKKIYEIFKRSDNKALRIFAEQNKLVKY